MLFGMGVPKGFPLGGSSAGGGDEGALEEKRGRTPSFVTLLGDTFPLFEGEGFRGTRLSLDFCPFYADFNQ